MQPFSSHFFHLQYFYSLSACSMYQYFTHLGGWIIFHCMYIAWFVYSFTYWWAFGLLPSFCCCEGCCYLLHVYIHQSFYLFILFSGPHSQHMEVHRLGVKWSNRSYSYWPMPQPQQRQIRAESMTYTTAHGKARSLTHLARPGIEPATSSFLVRFISAVPWREHLLISSKHDSNTQFMVRTLINTFGSN